MKHTLISRSIFIVLNVKKNSDKIVVLKRCCKTVAHINSSVRQSTIIWMKARTDLCEEDYP